MLVRPDRQNLPEHGRAVYALHARADKNGKIYQAKLRARCKASPVIRTKFKWLERLCHKRILDYFVLLKLSRD